MKVIADNKIASISVDSEDSEYPVANLLDEHPKRKWKAANSTVDSVTLVVTVSGVCDALGLVGIEADTAAVTISDPNEASFETGTNWETGTDWSSTPDDLSIIKEWVERENNASLWVDFGQFRSIADISVTLYTSAGSPKTISAGVMYVGKKQEFNDPRYGLMTGAIDYSINLELSNGARYYKQRDIVRTVSGIMLEDMDDYYAFALLHRTYGQTPLMWSFIDRTSNTESIIYARFSAPTTGTIDHLAHGNLTFDFTEVL